MALGPRWYLVHACWLVYKAAPACWHAVVVHFLSCICTLEMTIKMTV